MNELVTVKNNQSIMLMGQQGMIKASDEGVMQSIEIEVELSYRANHFCMIAGKGDNPDKYILTDEGLLYLSKFAGVSVVNCPTMILDGVEVENPYIVTDNTGRKKGLHVRTIVGGYDPYGEYVLTESIVQYNAVDEFLSAILTKMGYDKATNEKDMLGIMCPYDAFESLKKENPFRVFFPTDAIEDPMGISDPTILGIAVNSKHKDFPYLRKVQQEAIKFSERKLQTVGHRNAARKHPAIAVYSVNPETKYNDKGQKLDLIVKHKVVKWLNVDSAAQKKAIDEYLASNHQVDVTSYHETEPEITPDDANEIVIEPDDLVPVEEVVENSDDEERKKILDKIEKFRSRVDIKFDIPETKDSMTIMELEAILESLFKQEERND